MHHINIKPTRAVQKDERTIVRRDWRRVDDAASNAPANDTDSVRCARRYITRPIPFN